MEAQPTNDGMNQSLGLPGSLSAVQLGSTVLHDFLRMVNAPIPRASRDGEAQQQQRQRIQTLTEELLRAVLEQVEQDLASRHPELTVGTQQWEDAVAIGLYTADSSIARVIDGYLSSPTAMTLRDMMPVAPMVRRLFEAVQRLGTPYSGSAHQVLVEPLEEGSVALAQGMPVGYQHFTRFRKGEATVDKRTRRTVLNCRNIDSFDISRYAMDPTVGEVLCLPPTYLSASSAPVFVGASVVVGVEVVPPPQFVSSSGPTSSLSGSSSESQIPREALLNDIERALVSAQHRCLLHGASGVGKTHLAHQLAQRWITREGRDAHVRWFSASSREQLQADCYAFVRDCFGGGPVDGCVVEKLQPAMRRLIASTPKALLIFDGAGDESVVDGVIRQLACLSADGGRTAPDVFVIITTSSPSWMTHGYHSVEIPPFTDDEVQTFLEQVLSQRKGDVKRLRENVLFRAHVGNHPKRLQRTARSPRSSGSRSSQTDSDDDAPPTLREAENQRVFFAETPRCTIDKYRQQSWLLHVDSQCRRVVKDKYRTSSREQVSLLDLCSDASVADRHGRRRTTDTPLPPIDDLCNVCDLASNVPWGAILASFQLLGLTPEAVSTIFGAAAARCVPPDVVDTSVPRALPAFLSNRTSSSQHQILDCLLHVSFRCYVCGADIDAQTDGATSTRGAHNVLLDLMTHTCILRGSTLAAALGQITSLSRPELVAIQGQVDNSRARTKYSREDLVALLGGAEVQHTDKTDRTASKDGGRRPTQNPDAQQRVLIYWDYGNVVPRKFMTTCVQIYNRLLATLKRQYCAGGGTMRVERAVAYLTQASLQPSAVAGATSDIDRLEAISFECRIVGLKQGSADRAIVTDMTEDLLRLSDPARLGPLVGSTHVVVISGDQDTGTAICGSFKEMGCLVHTVHKEDLVALLDCAEVQHAGERITIFDILMGLHGIQQLGDRPDLVDAFGHLQSIEEITELYNNVSNVVNRQKFGVGVDDGTRQWEDALVLELCIANSPIYRVINGWLNRCGNVLVYAKVLPVAKRMLEAVRQLGTPYSGRAFRAQRACEARGSPAAQHAYRNYQTVFAKGSRVESHQFLSFTTNWQWLNKCFSISSKAVIVFECENLLAFHIKTPCSTVNRHQPPGGPMLCLPAASFIVCGPVRVEGPAIFVPVAYDIEASRAISNMFQ